MSDYKDDIKINQYRLHEEIINQPVLYLKWAEKAAHAMANRLTLEKQKKVIRAELDSQYRLKLEKTSEKITENRLDASIRTDKKYIKISEELINAIEEEAVMMDVKWAFQQRKTSLELLQQGIINGLYADPTVNTQKALRDKLNKKAE
jgi:hypothetical protein